MIVVVSPLVSVVVSPHVSAGTQMFSPLYGVVPHLPLLHSESKVQLVPKLLSQSSSSELHEEGLSMQQLQESSELHSHSESELQDSSSDSDSDSDYNYL